MTHPTIRLFSYGTLRQREVQLATFGRELKGQADALIGFSLSMLAIDDPAVVALSGEAEHPVLTHTGNPDHVVEGVIFEVTGAELAAADAYEVDAYERVAAVSRSGLETYVYVLATGR